MAYINTETMEYPIYEGDIRLKFPNVSFPLDFSPPEGYSLVEEIPIPNFDNQNYRIIEGSPIQINDTWTQVWNEIPLTEEEKFNNLMGKRNYMVISPLQAKVELLSRGLLEEVEDIVNNLEDPIIRLAWNSATEFKRLSPLVSIIAEKMNWGEEYLDELFFSAEKRQF